MSIASVDDGIASVDDGIASVDDGIASDDGLASVDDGIARADNHELDLVAFTHVATGTRIEVFEHVAR